MNYEEELKFVISLSEKEYNDIEERKFQEMLKKNNYFNNEKKINIKTHKNNIKIKNKKDITKYDSNNNLLPFCHYYTKENINVDNNYESYINNNKNNKNTFTRQQWLLKKKFSMVCLFCNTKQKCSKYCENCKNQISKYFCSKCNFHSNNEIFHCPKCKCCSKRSNDKYIKNICSICMLKDKVCSICCSSIADKDYQVDNNILYNIHDKCNNYFHKSCWDKFISHGGTRCPICRANIKN
jgi:hypothetical protein